MYDSTSGTTASQNNKASWRYVYSDWELGTMYEGMTVPARRESTCVSCGEKHGPSEYNSFGECEITQVKKLEAIEAKEKKHNENIRKLYWERYLRGN